VNVQVCKRTGSVTLHQETYIRRACDRFEITDRDLPGKGISPEDPKVSSSLSSLRSQMSAEVTLTDQQARAAAGFTLEVYQQMVGTLLYASLMTRPDIAHAVQLLARDLREEALTMQHFRAARRVFAYLRSTARHGVHYAGTGIEPVKLSDVEVKLEAYADAGFANDKETSRSTTGFFVLLNGSPVHWISKQQNYVVKSTSAAEFVAMAAAADELLWFSELLQHLTFTVAVPHDLHCDNEAAVALSRTLVMHDHLRGVRVCYHYLRDEVVLQKRIRPQVVTGALNLADILTKSLNPQIFDREAQRIVRTHGSFD
jgi:hypothetical protein